MSDCNTEWQDPERAREKLKEYILRKLGCDVVGVELSDEQLDDAIHDSELYWMMWVGRVRSVTMAVGSLREYPALQIAPDVDSVVDVYFDADDTTLKDVFGWADVEINPFQTTFTTQGGYSSLIQYMQYRETAQKIVSSDKDWMWDKTRRVLVLSPLRGWMANVKVVYLSRCFDYNVLRTYEWHLFRQFAYVKAMKTLAHIRMKFPEKPSATGSYSMDGDSLWSNAEAMEIMLEEKMRLLQRPVGIITG
jgi:hypothetical protein